MESIVITLTPEIAKRYLSKNKKNRSMSSKVHLYAEDMKAGRWKENGESIIIDKNGVVKDGQHRLSATIISQHEWMVPIVTGVEPSVMDTIDTGKNRSLSDILKLENVIRPVLSAALTRS